MRYSLAALMGIAFGLLPPATTANHHFDVTRYHDSVCSTVSLDIARVHMPKSGGMPLKLDKCYPAADKYFIKHPVAAVNKNDPDVFHSLAFRWAHVSAFHLDKTDGFYDNCTLFVYERPNCDPKGVVETKWDVDKLGLRDQCWSVGGDEKTGKGARSVMFRCVFN